MRTSTVFVADHTHSTCHAAAICEGRGGTLLAAWYAGTVEGAVDSVIKGSRLVEGASAWSPPVVWANVYGHATGNPRLFIGPDDSVWLLVPVNYGRWCRGGTRLFLKRSFDGGITWSDLELFLPTSGVLGKNKPLHLPSGIWLIPAEHERAWQITFIRSSDNGRHWKLIDPPGQQPRLHQPSLVRLNSGVLLAYMRSWEGYIYQSRSADNGATWSAPVPTSLPNNNSGIDLVRLNSGKLLLAFNPVGLGKAGNITRQPGSTGIGEVPLEEKYRRNRSELWLLDRYGTRGGQDGNEQYPAWGPRTPLSLAVSLDEGVTWESNLDLASGTGEYSYPAIIQSSDQKIHVVFTDNRLRIQHFELIEADIQ